MKGSATTGQASCIPSAAAIRSRSASVVRGTMRSTMLHGKLHCLSIHSDSAAGPCRSAKASTRPRSTWPLDGRLSSDSKVTGPSPPAWRNASPCTISATALPGVSAA